MFVDHLIRKQEIQETHFQYYFFNSILPKFCSARPQRYEVEAFGYDANSR